MRNKVWGLFAVICIIFCVNCSSIQAEAAGPRDGEIVDGSLLTSETSASDSFQNVLRNSYLASGLTHIINNNGVIYIGGETFASQISDSVKIYLYLERLEGKYWVPMDQRYTNERNNYYAEHGVYLSMAKGYYYRVRGSHSVTLGNDTDANYTVTSGIYIE